MRKRSLYRKFSCLVILFLYAECNAQQATVRSDSMCWDNLRPLRWSDFRALPPENEKMMAACTSSIIIDGVYNDSFPIFKITNNFLARQSWTRDTISQVLLKHEQGHFDISEIWARQLRKSVDSLNTKKVIDVEIYSVLIKRHIASKEKMGNDYDDQTNHGIWSKHQKRWNEILANYLKQSEVYSQKCE